MSMPMKDLWTASYTLRIASRSSWAETPIAGDRSKPADKSAAAVLFIFDFLRVLFEVEHDHPKVACADDPEQHLALALLEPEACLVGLAHVLERFDPAIADLRDDIEIREAAGACVAGELHSLDVDSPRALEMEEGIGELGDLLHRHVPLLALEVLALLLSLRRRRETDGYQVGPSLNLEGRRGVDRQGGKHSFDGREVGLIHAADRFPVHRDGDVPGPEPSFLRRRALINACHQDALLGVDVRALSEVLQRLETKAGPGPLDLAIFQDAPDHFLHHHRRDREGQIVGSAHAAGVDADDASVDVDQGAAGVSGVDRRIGLDPEVVRSEVEVALHGGDDAAGHRAFETVGGPHRHDQLAHLELIRIAEFGDGKGRLRLPLGEVELDDRQVRLRVQPDDLCRDFLPVGQDAANLGGLVGDVVVRHDVALIGDDGAGAEDLDLLHLPATELHRDRLNEDDGGEDLVLGFLDDFFLRPDGGAAQERGGKERGGKDSHGPIVPRGPTGVN